MGFASYKGRMNSFLMAWLFLKSLEPVLQRTVRRGKMSNESVHREIRSFLRMELPVEASDSLWLRPEMLTTLGAVNLCADRENVEQQAEAVKQEILALAAAQSRQRALQNEERNPSWLNVLQMTDYIRDPEGRPVHPFDYWEDCIEVYLLSHLYKRSNAKIAEEYSFKSTHCGSARAKLQVVAKMLREAEALIEAVREGNYPPKHLKGGKQPTMIFAAET